MQLGSLMGNEQRQQSNAARQQQQRSDIKIYGLNKVQKKEEGVIIASE
jgi:hypothetical protein